MNLAHELKRLRYEHAEMQALADQMRGLLALGHEVATPRLHPLWQHYQRQLTRHLKCEDWILYPRIQAEMAQNIQQVADAITKNYGHLAEMVERHQQNWDGEADDHGWAVYTAEIVAILALAEERAMREERELFPILACAYAPHKTAA